MSKKALVLLIGLSVCLTNGFADEVPEPTFWMYWIFSPHSIQRGTNDGTNLQTLVTGLTDATDIDLDVASGKMYWVESAGGKIQRANLDGSHVENLVPGLSAPRNIALDVASRKMYWIGWGTGIQRANLDGSRVENLVTTGLSVADGIALDTTARKMYWTNANPSRIQRANLDGSNVETLVRTGRAGWYLNASDIALDIAAGKMYWIDGGTALIIQRANLDGSNVETVITAEIPNSRFLYQNSIALDVAAGKMYCTVRGIGIQRANLDGSNVEDLFTVQNASGIALDIQQPGGPGPGPDPDPLDVNADGQVTVIDLAIVALFYGTQVPVGVSLPADVNTDGVVNLLDLTAVAQAIDAAGGGSNGLSLDDVEAALLAVAEQAADIEAVAEAPMRFSMPQHALSGGIAYSNVAAALADVQHLAGTDDVRFARGLPETVLSELLQLLAEMVSVPETTALLPNYPNPFNPETWIPYHLSKDAEVILTIYGIDGQIVRRLALGHQPAGIYQNRSRAAYWDGRNESGESMASGVYFYTLTAGEFTATRKLLIIK